MKYRTDFVTNSSSSCFCVTLKAEDENGKEVFIASEFEGLGDYDMFEPERAFCGEYYSDNDFNIEKIRNDLIAVVQGKTSYKDPEKANRIKECLQENGIEPLSVVKVIVTRQGGAHGEEYDNLELTHILQWSEVQENCDEKVMAEKYHTDTESIQLYIRHLQGKLFDASYTKSEIYHVFTGRTEQKNHITDSEYDVKQPDIRYED